MSRKPFDPSPKKREIVKTMAACGVPQIDIARVLKVDVKTLRLKCRDELDLGLIEANASVAQFLFNQAKGGSTSAAIFWLKARAGWRDVQQTQTLDADGNPVTPGATFVWTVLRDGDAPPVGIVPTAAQKAPAAARRARASGSTVGKKSATRADD